jgi:hypothetical protein
VVSGLAAAAEEIAGCGVGTFAFISLYQIDSDAASGDRDMNHSRQHYI